jgi:uncharacterized protein (DUF488 family)
VLLTVGHSTRPIDEFLALLTAHEVQVLADVRTVPKSRHNPQFEQHALAASLRSAGIEYRHMPELGGLRRPRPDSINTAWKNASFRGYADYMQTPAFAAGIDALVALQQAPPETPSGGRVVAIMCAEAVPWRCHRSLVADAILARGLEAREIASVRQARPHKLTPWAKIDGDRVTYPGVTEAT